MRVQNVMQLVWVVFFFTSGCGPNQPSPPKASGSKPGVSQEALCHRDFKVYRETVGVWRNSWAYVNDHQPDLVKGRQVSRAKITEQLNKCEGCNGVRIYYALPESSTDFPMAPELIFANTMNCDDSLSGDSLVLWSGDAGFIHVSEARSYICHWQTLVEGKQPNFSRTWGFTYERDAFVSAIESEEEVTFEFAVHTIDPSLDSLYGVPDHTPVQGSLVIAMVVGNPETTEGPLLDFSLPCPRFCGGNQVLNCAPKS